MKTVDNSDEEDKNLPPFYGALKKFVKQKATLWSTPGHASGNGLKSCPAGRDFYEFFGHHLFQADVSSSVEELGSILEHCGQSAEAEKRAAEIFGADTTFFVLNGTSTANKVVFFATVAPGDLVLVGRNCHKSVMHAIIMNEAVPIYLTPKPCSYGMIGPVGFEQFGKESIRAKISASRLATNRKAAKVQLTVLTNSTYDGIIYNADKIKAQMSDLTHFLLFDEAWYAYAAFHPFYERRYAMSPYIKRRGAHLPPVFATQSTHKLLLAFSQCSMLHFRQGTAKDCELDLQGLLEANLMHSSTSPFYPLFASLDVNTQIMKESGYDLINKAINTAVRFRRAIRRAGERYAKKGDWWFTAWQPENIHLTKYPQQWALKPDSKWTGMDIGKEDDLILDPLKVTLLTPGVNPDASMTDFGIPACIVKKYLQARGVIPEKIGFYNLLFLFAPGVSTERTAELLRVLHDFKLEYNDNAPVAKWFSSIAAAYPKRYENMGLADLCKDMHAFLKSNDIMKKCASLYSELPEQAVAPHKAYYGLSEGKTEYVELCNAPGRVSVFMILPYPPGVPVIMPGERFPSADSPIMLFLRLNEGFENTFPGFETEFHGIKKTYENGKVKYWVSTLNKNKIR
ncbi:MAG: lysine decarboxylase [Elusimicrobiota bacterium]|jgi:arginine decarboxylase|nr:lysine decarboxylase [Elusimicrobiota bacterium]